MEWEKIFENHISDKGFISKIYKELLKLNNNNNKKVWLKSGQKNWTDIFFPKNAYKWSVGTWKVAPYH